MKIVRKALGRLLLQISAHDMAEAGVAQLGDAHRGDGKQARLAARPRQFDAQERRRRVQPTQRRRWNREFKLS
jgi:hypothetical protein